MDVRCVMCPPILPEEQLCVRRGLFARQQRLGRVFLQDVSDLMAPLNHGRLQGVDDTLVHLPTVEFSNAVVYKTETCFGQCTELLLSAPVCFVYLLSASREACSALSEPAGRGSRVLPWTRPDITNTLVLRAWTWRLISWDTTCGHSLWFWLLHRRGATTWRGRWKRIKRWLLTERPLQALKAQW